MMATPSCISMRELFLFVGFIGFAVAMLCIVFGSSTLCSAKQSQFHGSDQLLFELEYVSEKIAQCKKDGFDFESGAGVILPWLTVLFFPFILLEFDNAFCLILKTRRLRSSTVHPTFDSRTRGETAMVPIMRTVEDEEELQHVLQPDDSDYAMNPDRPHTVEPLLPIPLKGIKTPQHTQSSKPISTGVIVLVLESLAVGGYTWLVVWNHDDEHRIRHVVATGLTFGSITILNMMLVWTYWYMEARQDSRFCPPLLRRGSLFLLVLGLCASVVIFGLSAFHAYESKNAVAWEYIVIIIWVCTIVYQFCLGHYFFTSMDNNDKLSRKDWFVKSFTHYLKLLFIGILVVFICVIFIPAQDENKTLMQYLKNE